MIRVEVVEKNGHFAHSLDTDKKTILVGRRLDADIILPDFEVDLKEVEIKIVENGFVILSSTSEKSHSSQATIKFKGYKMRVTNLAHFAGENKVLQRSQEWKLTLALVGICYFTMAFSALFIDTGNMTFLDMFQIFGGITIGLFIFSVSMSFVGKAITGEHKIWRAINLVVTMSFIGTLVATNFFGLRWLGPRVLWTEPVWRLTTYAAGALILWLILDYVMDHASSKIRNGLIVALVGLIFLVDYSGFLPFDDKYEFAKVEPPPPLIEIFESKPVSEKDFENQLKELMD